MSVAHRLVGVPVGVLVTCLLIAPVVAPTAGASSRAVRRSTEQGNIVRVIDGDTVDVRLLHGRVARVRLVGIDTPEVFGQVECGGRRASASLHRLLPRGSRERLASDPSQADRDRYHRLLRYVTTTSTNGDANKAQLARGWARVDVFNHRPFNRYGSYRSAQRSAQTRHLGIWAICHRPVPSPPSPPAPASNPTPTSSPTPSAAPTPTDDLASYPPISTYDCPAFAPIKGNESSMIYDLPSSATYGATTPEQCFATEAGAVAHGFRRARD